MSDYESDVEVKPKSKKQITDAQRKARFENLRKGRETRAANLEKKKTKQETKSKKHTYEVQESSSDSESDIYSSSSDEEELVLSRKSKVKKPVQKPSKEDRSSKYASDEIAELKATVQKLVKDRLKKKKSVSKKTIINIEGPSSTPAKSNNAADFYKSKLLDL